jgi:hypothetical protein
MVDDPRKEALQMTEAAVFVDHGLGHDAGADIHALLETPPSYG